MADRTSQAAELGITEAYVVSQIIGLERLRRTSSEASAATLAQLEAMVPIFEELFHGGMLCYGGEFLPYEDLVGMFGEDLLWPEIAGWLEHSGYFILKGFGSRHGNLSSDASQAVLEKEPRTAKLIHQWKEERDTGPIVAIICDAELMQAINLFFDENMLYLQRPIPGYRPRGLKGSTLQGELLPRIGLWMERYFPDAPWSGRDMAMALCEEIVLRYRKDLLQEETE